MQKHLYPFFLLPFLLLGLASCDGPLPSESPVPSNSPPPASGLLSTEFGRNDWTDTAYYDAGSPGTDFYIGAWTHTVEDMGSYTSTGNDYPFVISCSETVGDQAQLLLTISGNIGYDSLLGSYQYNQNITTNTGDYATVYIRADAYGVEGQPDEAAMRGWVYVAWHYRKTAQGTEVKQYTKFGLSGPVMLSAEATINGQGGWPPAATPTPEFVTPLSISLGGGDRGNGRMYMQYAKVYATSQAPTVEKVAAIALNTTPDATAWADWPLVDGSMDDVSGKGRHLTRKGTPLSGITGPEL